MTLKTLLKTIRDFFFKPLPVQSTALLRILFGVLLLVNWYMMVTHLNIFWGSEGIVSLKTSEIYGPTGSFNFFSYMPDDPRVAQLLVTLNLFAAMGVLLGLFTRTSVIFAFLTVLSFHNRNIFILNSADIFLRDMLFFMIFTPAGEAYSLDRLWKLRFKLAPPQPVERAPWGLRLMQIQFCMVYIATVMFKMKGNYWADGTAIYIATRLDEFVRVPLAMLNNLWVIKILTWSTLVVEFSLGTLVWIRELRYWVLLAGVGLHLGIEITMNIPMFEWVMMVAMVCMIDPLDYQKFTNWLRLKKESRQLARKSSASI